ncbi:MAG: hypothetical protein ACRC7O_12520 [Fimbriiglobus sp.]
MNRLLTKTGYELWLELNGTPVQAVRPERPPHKVLARGGSLMGNVDDPVTLWAWCVRHLERLCEELAYHQVRTDRLVVQVAYRDHEPGVGVAPLDHPCGRFDQLLDAARTGLRRAYKDYAMPATHMWVCADSLRRAKGFQMSLFEHADPQREQIADLKAAVNEKFGRFKLRSGATLHLPAVYADPSNDFDICDVRGKVCF